VKAAPGQRRQRRRDHGTTLSATGRAVLLVSDRRSCSCSAPKGWFTSRLDGRGWEQRMTNGLAPGHGGTHTG
jgi:hypothetical protein